MKRVDPQLLRETIRNAPAWARIGLTAPREQTRQAAAVELAAVIATALEGAAEEQDSRQMALPL